VTPDVSFSIDGTATADALVVGLPHLGMASLTAVDHLVRTREAAPVGHVAAHDVPAVAPFEEGRPRHHTRVYDLADLDLAVLVGELFVPVWAADAFVRAVAEWCGETGVEEVAVLHGVPYPHGEEDHAVFTVADEAVRESRLAGTGLDPLPGGFLDGVPGELLTRSMEGEGPATGVYVTPTHPPGPDMEAAIRLLSAVETVYGVDVDLAALEAEAAERERQFAELASRMEQLREAEEGLGSRDYPEDRMYM